MAYVREARVLRAGGNGDGRATCTGLKPRCSRCSLSGRGNIGRVAACPLATGVRQRPFPPGALCLAWSSCCGKSTIPRMRRRRRVTFLWCSFWRSQRRAWRWNCPIMFGWFMYVRVVEKNWCLLLKHTSNERLRVRSDLCGPDVPCESESD